MREGTVLKHGTFVIVAEIGRGGFGEVYLARQPKMAREVAIKVLLPLAAATLVHPNVLPVYDFDFDDEAGVWFLAMQYVPGGKTLKEWIGAPLRLEDAARVIEGVGSALDQAHEHGIIHRDVKPANVLLDRERPLLTDFGIAHLGSMAGLTATGMAIGTPAYMSPEQAMGKPVGPKSDQYALAVMTYEMLAARLPFVGSSMTQALAHVQDEAPSLALMNPAVSEPVAGVVSRAMSKNPDDRYDTCVEFARTLVRAAAAQATFAQATALSTGTGAPPASAAVPVSAAPSVANAGAVTGAPLSMAEPPNTADQTLAAAPSGIAPFEGASTGPQASLAAAPVPSVAEEPVVQATPSGAVGAQWSRIEELQAQDAARSELRQSASTSARPKKLPLPLIGAAGVGLLAIAVIALVLPQVVPRAAPVPPGEQPTPAPATVVSGDPARPIGTLRLTSSPEGAAIIVDGEPAARTPRQLNLAPGEHNVVIAMPSFREWTRRISVIEGQSLNVAADLDPLPAPETLEMVDRRMGRDPFVDAKGVVRLGTLTDTFLLSDDVNAVLYFRPTSFDVRDVSYTITYRWQRADGAEPIELSGERIVTKDLDEWYDRGCAPATALDGRGSNSPLNVDVLIDGTAVGQFTFRIAGGSPANRPQSACDVGRVPTTSV
ncbi:MAG: protein kinase [Chloroflexi bacterium]|nr:protein kinase [Chloroflexota bacterium]